MTRTRFHERRIRVRPFDDFGHGTHVSGLIAGTGAASDPLAPSARPTPQVKRFFVYRGVAPAARLVSLKVLDRNGQGRTSDVIAALEFVVQHRKELHVDIVNLSLGHPIYEPAATDPLVAAVEQAVRSGLVVVVAAGNVGRNPITNATRLCGHHRTRQCAVRDHGRGGRYARNGHAHRRRGGLV